ncbi:hypothetical protein [Streptomyces sp. NRRL S-118]|uniref:hypothetical protein n=1 Tax=Streptomyces sp. NRRL S-118 TaxID=1463881 RepID=UPI00131C0D44|nr:hypothetical protein [Streptomyces sp. NRRL S-118]
MAPLRQPPWAKPLVNGPVLNDPFRTADHQKAVFTQLIAPIDAMPAGRSISGSTFLDR